MLSLVRSVGVFGPHDIKNIMNKTTMPAENEMIGFLLVIALLIRVVKINILFLICSL